MTARNPLLAATIGAFALATLAAAPAGAEVVPQRLIDTMGEQSVPAAAVRLVALMAGGGEASEATRWRVFERVNDDVGGVVARGTGAAIEASLRPGTYVAHIALAGTSIVRPFSVAAEGGTVPFELAIGAVSLSASSNGAPLAPSDETSGTIAFSLYDTHGERRAIRRGVAPGERVVLPAGVYRAVVRYGEHNALTGADIRVRPGEVTHATLGVSGAPVRLSLVSQESSDAALAAVSWRVFDSGGKPLMDSDEPAPSLVLAPGRYTAEALHDGWTGVHPFEVVSGKPLDLKLPVGD